MKRLLLICAMIACAAPLALAQDDYNKYDIFVGYSHNRVDTGVADTGDDDFDDFFDNREGFHGVNASVTGNVSRYVGLKFDYAYHQKSFTFGPLLGQNFEADVKLHNFLGGVQFKDNSKERKVKPFAHLLAGGVSARAEADIPDIICIQVIGAPCPTDLSETENGFAAAVGGGIDFKVSDRVDIRAIQFDYNPTRLGGETQHNFRVGVGVVFR